MIHNLYNLLEKILTFNLYNTLLSFISILLIFTLYNLFKLKLYFVDYKIYNFNLNKIYIFIYFLIFIFGVLFLRYLRLGNEFDIKAFFFLLKIFLKDFSFLGTINLILIILIFISIFNKIKIFFYYQIKKRHLYYYFYSFCKTYKYFVEKQRREPLQYYDFDLYVNIIDNLSSSIWCYKYFHRLIISRIVYFPFYCLYNEEHRLIFYQQHILLVQFLNRLISMLTFLFKLLPYILLIFFFVYDVLFNNNKLIIFYYYLPFLFFYQIWKNVSLSVSNHNESLSLIVYYFYYESERIFFIDLLDIEYDYILTYIKNNFICFTKKIKSDDIEATLNYSYYIRECTIGIRNREYFLEKDNFTLYNPYTGDKININDIEIIETWPLLKRKKKNNDYHVEAVPFLSFDSFINRMS